MSELRLVEADIQAEAVIPSASFTEAEEGELTALTGLLASAKVQHGFQYEGMKDVVTRMATETDQLPYSAVTWGHMAALDIEQGEVAAAREWQAIKQAAREELASGHRAGSVLEAGRSTPIERARFIVLRESLAAEWQPRGGQELSLIDALAQAATAQSYWMETLMMRTKQEAAEDLRDRQELSREEKLYRFGHWIPERISTSEALQEASLMLDRFNRMYLRLTRTLRDLRRYNVIIQSASQVNLGERQVNVSQNEVAAPKKALVKRRRKTT